MNLRNEFFAVFGLMALGLSGCIAARPVASNGQRTTLLVQVPAEPVWQDMAYLAAVPAAMVLNSGAPSLIACNPGEPLSPEIEDYLRRYRPDAVIMLGDIPADQGGAGRTCSVVRVASAAATACELSRRCWLASATAVLCDENDYDAALVAAPLAARLRAPLLFSGATGLSPAAADELKRLKARELVVIGEPGGRESLRNVTKQATALRNAREVAAWMRKRGLPVTYVAAVNPQDRNKTVIQKLSLAGALLAAGRDGVVAPLPNEFHWEVPVNAGAENRADKPSMHLIGPRAEQVCDDLRQFYQALGGAPEHLCLVGFPDAIPQAIFGKGDAVSATASDLPYANADDDPFAEIGVARLVAETVSFATLYASRVLTYRSLLDPEWQDRACMANWENTYGDLFRNVGFDASYRHTEQQLEWIEPPGNGHRGKKATTFLQSSPLARCAVLAHENHSWWHELGQTFAWDAEVLLAPVVIESGGCLTAALDREPDCRSVIARLFRKGAIAFSGNSREGIAECELQRQEFWNGVLSGLTIGQAHRRSINSAMVTILDKKESAGGGYLYQQRIRTQFGDPAFVLRVPGPPRSAPARSVVSNDILSVYAPEQWWPVKMHVPADWKKWADKDLHVVRGAGAYARRTWCGGQYDREEMYVTAEFTTRRRVARIEQVQLPPAPLGWSGAYYADEHADGSRTYRWAVRVSDFDQIKGDMVNAVKRLDYRITDSGEKSNE